MQGITKTFTVSGTKGMSARVTVTEEYDITANASVLSVAVALASSTYAGYTYYLSGTVAAAGKTLQSMSNTAGTHHVTVNKKDTYYAIRGHGRPGSPWSTASLTHNNDGTLTVTVALDLTGYEANGNGANGFTVKATRSVTLTQIPRAATVSATDALIGATTLVAISRKSSDYVHSLGWSFGALSGYLSADGTISDTETVFTETLVPFTLPQSFYNEIPDAPSGKCTLSCKTYLGETQVGDTQLCQFTVNADPAESAPVITASITDTNEKTVALTGDAATVVRYASEVQCAFTAEARHGAAITEKAVNDTLLTEDTASLPALSGYRFSAADSRGYRTNLTITPAFVPYVLLTCRAAAKRDDPTSGDVTLTVAGECYNGSFGAENNTLLLRCSAGGDWVDIVPEFLEHTFTATAKLTGLSYDRRHTITVQASDALMEVSCTASVDKGIPVFDWGEEDFTFHVPVVAEEGVFDGEGKQAFVPSSRTVCGYPLTADITLTPADIGTLPFVESQAHPGCYCRDVLGETEWLNPPMVEGIEYRTARRWGGLPVYVQRLLIESLPNDGTANIPLELPAEQILECRNAIRTDAGYLVQSPYFTASGSLLIKHLFTGKNLQISTTSDYRGAVANFTVYYVKEATYV